MIMKKDKCEMWKWVDPLQILTPHFDASEFAIECFLKKRFYIAEQK